VPAAASRPVAAANINRYRPDLFKRFMTLPCDLVLGGTIHAIGRTCAAAATTFVRLLRGYAVGGSGGIAAPKLEYSETFRQLLANATWKLATGQRFAKRRDSGSVMGIAGTETRRLPRQAIDAPR
jgi:hypothetical protein